MQPHACDLTENLALAPCTIVIFGASGDLTSRKLIPALFTLFTQKKLPQPFTIVGCSRTEMDDFQFRTHLKKLCHGSVATMEGWDDFAEHLYYTSIAYEQSSFLELANYLDQLDQQKGTERNRIFDLAVPPVLYPIIGELLGTSGLANEKRTNQGWSRIIVEKPFGHNLESARTLDATLHAHFDEKQIFRIDHYLAKETVQNTLIFRFATLFLNPSGTTTILIMLESSPLNNSGSDPEPDTMKNPG